MKIVPALLAEKFDEFLLRLREAEGFADYAQIDLMDGNFVGTKSFPPERINTLNTALSFELHLMVKDPSAFFGRINHGSIKKVIFHVEAEGDHPGFIEKLKGRGLDAGLAINPETGITQIKEVAENVDTLLFLTVDPCCYGSAFKPEVLDKIAEARRFFPAKVIAADGGVSFDNLKMFYDIGVDYVCVGSRIFLDGDPKENYLRFAEKAKEFEKRT